MHHKNKAVFLDRDGVINELVIVSEEGFVDSPNSSKQFALINGVIKALKILKKSGYLLIIISNQPGIAKRQYTIKEFNKIKEKMEKGLGQHKITLDAQYYCLHHPHAKVSKYKIKCKCRKPHTKLVTDALKEYNIELKKSFFIGDGIIDMQLAKKIRCKGIFIGNVNSTISNIFHVKKISPFYIAHDLLEAAKYIKQLNKTQYDF
jgi:D-glycero-D-manno-heptose 1,7-bisphosphate phosphatase